MIFFFFHWDVVMADVHEGKPALFSSVFFAGGSVDGEHGWLGRRCVTCSAEIIVPGGFPPAASR